MSRLHTTFLALVVTQAFHSVEEYLGRLWESFPPAAFLTGLVSTDREVGFVVINSALVLFGFWCFFVPVRRHWRSASTFMWFWIALQTINGIGHSAWSLFQGAYTPGVLTAPLLLFIALYLAVQLHRAGNRVSQAA